MNAMYKNRVFLPIPNFYGQDLTLYQQIVLANKINKHQLELWFLDPDTIAKHQNISFTQPKHHAWSFYLPTRDCPLTWRELAMWFMLWSIAKGTPKHPGKGPTFQDHFTGLEMLLGLGQREARPLCERLVVKSLIDMEIGTNRQKTWFQLFDYKPYAHWFEELIDETPMPDRFKVRLDNAVEKPQETQPEAQPQEYEPEAVLLMLNQEIPEVVKKKGIPTAKYWWERAESKGVKPKYNESDMLEVQEALAKLKQQSEKPKEETNNEPRHIEEQHGQDDDDFLQRLRTM